MSVSPRAVTDALAPLSAKHVQSTTKRALRGAQPLRDDVQEKLNKLNHRGQDVASIDTDVVDAIAGLEEKRAQAYRHILEEFEMQKRLIQEEMTRRENILCDMASEHYRIVEEKLNEKRELLTEEDACVKHCLNEGIEALALDDAWFIQAYPDINLEGGSSVTGSTRSLLQSQVGSWSVDFGQELQGNAKFDRVHIPSIGGHGQVVGAGQPTPVKERSPPAAYQPPPRPTSPPKERVAIAATSVESSSPATKSPREATTPREGSEAGGEPRKGDIFERYYGDSYIKLTGN